MPYELHLNRAVTLRRKANAPAQHRGVRNAFSLSQKKLRLVASYGFGGFFFCLVGCAVSGAFGMAVTLARMGCAKARPYTGVGLSGSDGYRLAGVGKICWDRLGNILQRANLHGGLLGLLQHQLFVDGADLG